MDQARVIVTLPVGLKATEVRLTAMSGIITKAHGDLPLAHWSHPDVLSNERGAYLEVSVRPFGEQRMRQWDDETYRGIGRWTFGTFVLESIVASPIDRTLPATPPGDPKGLTDKLLREAMDNGNEADRIMQSAAGEAERATGFEVISRKQMLATVAIGLELGSIRRLLRILVSRDAE